jgi:hypothetical protein
MEDPETVATIRVRDIVGELTELGVLWADVLIEARSDGCLLEVVPVRVTIGASSMVASDDIIRVCNPDTGRCLVCVEKTPRAADVYNQIILDQILGLSRILNENSVAHSVVRHIILHAQIMNSVDGDSSIEGVVDRIIADVRRVHCANHMEMNGVGSEDEGLADVEELNTVNSCSRSLITGRVHNYDRTVLIFS